jgi:hypothetical protein
MDDPCIYNFFKKKLGHDIAEMLYDLTHKYIVLTTKPTLVYSKKCTPTTFGRKIYLINNYVKIDSATPEAYVEFTINYKQYVSTRKILANQLEIGKINLTNSCTTKMRCSGPFYINVYAKMLSAGKMVIDSNFCRLNIKII